MTLLFELYFSISHKLQAELSSSRIGSDVEGKKLIYGVHESII